MPNPSVNRTASKLRLQVHSYRGGPRVDYVERRESGLEKVEGLQWAPLTRLQPNRQGLYKQTLQPAFVSLNRTGL